VGGEFQVNTYTTGSQRAPAVVVNADGDFVAVWETPEIQGQRYDASGNAVGSEFQVTSPVEYFEDEGPSVAADANGEFVVVWQSRWRFSYYNWISGKHYDSNGNLVAPGFLPSPSSYYCFSPAVAASGNEDSVVVWEGPEIQAHRFTFHAPLVPSLSPPGVIGLAALLLGIAAVGLRSRLGLRG
jgi:hypothetical protein